MLATHHRSRAGYRFTPGSGGYTTEEHFPIWVAALETGYLPLRALERWADEQILRLDNPPVWIIDVSLASSVEAATTVLWQAVQVAAEAGRWNGGANPGRGHVWLGFLYLAYERGDLSMAELLNRAGGWADGRKSEIPCEEFYYLLNEIDGGGPTIPSDRPLAERVAELFAPFAARARQCLSRLPGAPIDFQERPG